MSGKPLRKNAAEWIPASAPAEEVAQPASVLPPVEEAPAPLAEPAPEEAVVELPPTRYRVSAQKLAMSHDQTTCDIDGTIFADKLTTSMMVPDQETAKLKIEYCRDARIQETLEYEYHCSFHVKLVDLHINLREAFEPPLPKGTTVSYVNIKERYPPQYYIVTSPSPVPEPPWYGGQEIQVSSDDILLTENPLNTPYSRMLSNYYHTLRKQNLVWMRIYAMEIALNYINPDKREKSCYYKQSEYYQLEYRQAYQNNILWFLLHPVPPAPPFPSSGGKRKKTRKDRGKKRTATRKIGKARLRKI
jgi:hypothetical protein